MNKPTTHKVAEVFNERDCLKIDALIAIQYISKLVIEPCDSLFTLRRYRQTINQMILKLEVQR